MNFEERNEIDNYKCVKKNKKTEKYYNTSSFHYGIL